MTNLFKHDGNVVKLRVLPKIDKNKVFRDNFFKLSKYMAKVVDKDSIDYVECLSYLGLLENGEEENLSVYDWSNPVSRLHIHHEVDLVVSRILNQRVKNKDDEGIKVIYSEDGSLTYLIVQKCSINVDGAEYVSRKKMKHSNVRIFSLGYLLLASSLQEILQKSLGDQKSLFTYRDSKYWHRNDNILLYEVALHLLLKREYNYSLNHRYSQETGKTIATFRTDKKYQDEELNKKTIFNKLGFRKVEVDTQKIYQTEAVGYTEDGETIYENVGIPFNYEEFCRVEEDFQKLHDNLPKSNVSPELKFRRLGKHHATGLYCPTMNIIAVDVRDTTSFIHEYGHYLDFKYQNEKREPISLSVEFEILVDKYRDSLEYLNTHKYNNVLSKSKMEYFGIPTEIFARSFELWVLDRFVSDETNSTLLNTKKYYNTSIQYLAIDPIKKDAFKLFDNIFSKENK